MGLRSLINLVFFSLFINVYAVWKNDTIVYKRAVSLSLDGSWIASNTNKSIVISAVVPGSIYTDLWRNKLIDDPYFGKNDVLYKWIGNEHWTFFKKFDVECHLLQKKRIILVFNGLDTVSKVFLNDNLIGSSNNMFVRYVFDVKSTLKANNTLKISFESPVLYASRKNSKQVLNYVIPPTCPPPVQKGECHVNYIRKMQSSFSWDWGPSFPTQGIWKSVEVIGYNSLLITDITVITTQSNHISAKKTFESIIITIFVDTATSEAVSGTLNINVNGTELFNSKVVVKPDSNSKSQLKFNLKLPKDFDVQLWWPSGIGNQPLYLLKVNFSTDEERSYKAVKFGFRTIELVQEPVVNSSGLSFYFRVNGIPFFAKGSNWIPADSFQERISSGYIKNLLQSAKDANMNMLRVWGGGIYERDIFYELADEMGLLIWQDLMFACALYPTDEEFLQSVSQEISQVVRHLQHHPSIILWAGNNENEQSISGRWWPPVSRYLEQYKTDYVKLYINTIMPIVLKEDPSRVFLPSSPSNGPKTTEEGWISDDPQDLHFGDVHFYTYSGNEWDPSTFPRARFVSEYGFQSYPSFESLANVSKPEDWVYPFNDFMQHRQHHMFGNAQIARMIEEHFILPSKSCGIDGFKDVLYLSQIVQSVAIKTETEKYRRSQSEIIDGAGKTMGALYWQLNDVWQGPSWSSIEYGGKWKMLHYYAKNFFSPVIVSPYEENDAVFVAVISDLLKPLLKLQLDVSVFSWCSFEPLHVKNIKFSQPPSSSQIVYQENINNLLKTAKCFSRKTCFIYFVVSSAAENISSNNILYLSNFHSTAAIEKPSITTTVSGPYTSEISPFTFSITLKTNHIAPFVWLDVENNAGRFSDNGFTMIFESMNIFYYSRQNISTQVLSHNMQVKSLRDCCLFK